jgi:hypothetical protein
MWETDRSLDMRLMERGAQMGYERKWVDDHPEAMEGGGWVVAAFYAAIFVGLIAAALAA